MAVAHFTPPQALAHRVLTYAIADARDSGLDVPCIADPATWDRASSGPGLCAGCPVLRQCGIYADTGAVEHGVIAGRRIRRRRRRTVEAA